MGCRDAEEADGGQAALHRLKSKRFDFVVADIDMPDMDGLALLKAIKSDECLQHLPVLMMADEARKEEMVRAALSGAAGYIVKPLTPATLEEKLLKIVTRLAQPA
jgi:two-component system chemotaxis response regulator CheY